MKQKRRLVQWTIAIVLLAAGLFVIIYPHVMQWLYDMRTESEHKGFAEQLQNPKDENMPYAKLYSEMTAYNEKIFSEGQKELSNPQSYEQASFNLSDYGLKDEIFGYISIPKIDVLLPIYLGASEENMKKGATHLSQTSLPIGGENTNSVICGHRGYWGAKMFKYLVNLESGDEVTVSNPWYSMTYTVSSTTTIQDNELDDLKIQNGRDMLTLFTCYFRDGRKDRFVVYCERKE